MIIEVRKILSKNSGVWNGRRKTVRCNPSREALAKYSGRTVKIASPCHWHDG